MEVSHFLFTPAVTDLEGPIRQMLEATDKYDSALVSGVRIASKTTVTSTDVSTTVTLAATSRDAAAKTHEAESAASSLETQPSSGTEPIVDVDTLPTLILHEVRGPDYFNEDDEQPDITALRLCSVHQGVMKDEAEMHSNLTDQCEGNHYNKDLLICTPCLHECLESKMFPLGAGDIQSRFPADKVRCWSPGCVRILSHSEIQKHADPAVFEVYDRALCQRALVRDATVVQCANSDCQCFTWIDDKLIKDLQRFRCPECCRQTCRDCNDLYEKHFGQVCPSRKKRLSAKYQLEEFASKLTLARKHKCPECSLKYEKIDGCDHITCGGTMWDQYTFGKCSRFLRLDCVSIGKLCLEMRT